MQPQIKIVKKIWYSTFDGTIGIILTNDGFVERAFIGICMNTNELDDAKRIVDFGQRIPVEVAKLL